MTIDWDDKTLYRQVVEQVEEIGLQRMKAQPGMSDEAARRQGAAMEEGFRQMCREVVAEEFGQGGSMWRR